MNVWSPSGKKHVPLLVGKLIETLPNQISQLTRPGSKVLVVARNEKIVLPMLNYIVQSNGMVGMPLMSRPDADFVANVNMGLDMCQRTGCTAVIALGDEYTLNVAKAVASLVGCGNFWNKLDRYELGQYKAGNVAFRDSLPVITIPTTLQVGVEASSLWTGVNYIAETRYKANDESIIPNSIMLDPQLISTGQKDKAALFGTAFENTLRNAQLAALGQILALSHSQGNSLSHATSLLSTSWDSSLDDRVSVTAMLSAELGRFAGAASASPGLPHVALSCAICDAIPLSYNDVSSIMLGKSWNLWSEDHKQTLKYILKGDHQLDSHSSLSQIGMRKDVTDEEILPIAEAASSYMNDEVSPSFLAKVIKEAL